MGGLKTNRSMWPLLVSVVLCAGFVCMPGTTNAQDAQRRQSHSDSFFIISSVDAKKHQIVLKLPTEVTEVVEVTPATVYRDERGKSLKFEDLRAGDTVYATLRRNEKGALTVRSIRRGPMTPEELRARYLREE